MTLLATVLLLSSGLAYAQKPPPAPATPAAAPAAAPTPKAAPAPAPSADAKKEAMAHITAAREAEGEGNHEKAIAEYEAAYKLVAKVQLLISLALEYREAGKLDQARERLQAYLREAPADDAKREEAQQLLNKFDAEAEAAKPPPPPSFEAEAIALQTDDGEKPEREAKAAPLPGVTLGAGLPTKEKPRTRINPDTPFYKTWWFWTVTAVVVGGAVAIGVVASRPREATIHGCPADVIGCFGDGR